MRRSQLSGRLRYGLLQIVLITGSPFQSPLHASFQLHEPLEIRQGQATPGSIVENWLGSGMADGIPSKASAHWMGKLYFRLPR